MGITKISPTRIGSGSGITLWLCDSVDNKRSHNSAPFICLDQFFLHPFGQARLHITLVPAIPIGWRHCDVRAQDSKWRKRWKEEIETKGRKKLSTTTLPIVHESSKASLLTKKNIEFSEMFKKLGCFYKISDYFILVSMQQSKKSWCDINVLI